MSRFATKTGPDSNHANPAAAGRSCNRRPSWPPSLTYIGSLGATDFRQAIAPQTRQDKQQTERKSMAKHDTQLTVAARARSSTLSGTRGEVQRFRPTNARRADLARESKAETKH
jgi:hypothetical protein